MTPLGNLPAYRLESAAVIPDLHLDLLGGEIEDHLDSRGMRMLYDIGQGFFADAKHVMVEDIIGFPRGTLHREA